MLLEKLAEIQNGGLVGVRGATQIDADKAAQRGRLVERILGARIGEVEPMLQNVNAQHDRHADRLTATQDAVYTSRYHISVCENPLNPPEAGSSSRVYSRNV